ncbi:MAG: zinc ribbon domain-containing protein [Candidatus Riflebacteria bacterium]|nr:zinc ribbon domain-containing protein [Candidatus Riflebacteria bacterium]
MKAQHEINTIKSFALYISQKIVFFCMRYSERTLQQRLFPFILCLIFLLACSASSAKICVHCTQQIPDRAKFCESCGKMQSSDAQKQIYQPSKSIFTLFAVVDDFEKVVSKGVYTNIIGGFPEFKSVCSEKIRQFSQIEKSLPEELQIIGKMYINKAKAFNSTVIALKTLRLDSTYSAALIRYYSFLVDQYNQAIQMLRNAKSFSGENLKQLKIMVKNIEGKAQKYTVTGKFLKIGKSKIKNGTPFVVLKMNKGKAQILILAEEGEDEPVSGWESLKSLRERTTWNTQSESYYSDSAD